MNTNQIKTGDILLVDSDSFIANAIDKFQGNRFNHAGIFVRVFNQLYIAEATETGVGFALFSKYEDEFNKEKVDLMILRDKGDKFEKVFINDLMRFILPKTVLEYDYSNLLIYQPIRYIAKKLFGKEIWIGRKKIKSHKTFICGEFVAYIYNNYLGYFDKWNELAPVDLFDSKDFLHYNFKIK